MELTELKNYQRVVVKFKDGSTSNQVWFMKQQFKNDKDAEVSSVVSAEPYLDVNGKEEFRLDKTLLNQITHITRRSDNQTQFLFNLLGGDVYRLEMLELQLVNCFVSYCPDTLEEVETVMAMKAPKCKLLRTLFIKY